MLMCGIAARLKIGLGIGSAEESNAFVAGKGICRWAGTKFINNQRALVSRGLLRQFF